MPFFLRQRNCSHPFRLVASQPSPVAPEIDSFAPPANDAGASEAAAAGAATPSALAAGSAPSTGFETGDRTEPDAASAALPGGSALLHATTPTNTKERPKCFMSDRPQQRAREPIARKIRAPQVSARTPGVYRKPRVEAATAIFVIRSYGAAGTVTGAKNVKRYGRLPLFKSIVRLWIERDGPMRNSTASAGSDRLTSPYYICY